MTDEVAIPRASRGRKEIVRYIIGVAAGFVVLLLLFGKRSELLPAWRQLSHADFGWVIAAVSAEALSLLTFGYLQNLVLRLSGANVPLGPLAALSLANEAIANTVPGEPAISSAYRYRFYRRFGASGASAGWTIFTILVAQAMSMSLLLLLGVLVALAGSTGGEYTGLAIVGLVIVVAAVAVLARRDLILRLAEALTRAAGRGARRGTGDTPGLAARIESTFARMREIPLSVRSTLGVVGVAAAVWLGDFLCLVCSFWAIHAAVPWDGVLLAYGVAQVAGSLPIVPGGIGIIEGSLAIILITYGASRPSALAAALIYRIISFWLSITVGWISVGMIAHWFRRRQ
jgi:putative heme transporter